MGYYGVVYWAIYGVVKSGIATRCVDCLHRRAINVIVVMK